MPRYAMVTLWLLSALMVAGCIQSGQVQCADGRVCPAEHTCSVYGCISQDQISACAQLADGDMCSTTRGSGVCAEHACLVSICGNEIIEGLEVCDDGNTFSGDGCDGTCRSNEICGNGIAELGEECDCGDGSRTPPASCDGTTNGGAHCSETCKRRGCGNEVKDPEEECDDGNLISGDGCSADCLSLETCGNTIIDYAAGELCEDGDDQDHDGCSDCRTETARWKQALPGVPGVRRYTAMAYDAARGRVVLFGGDDGNLFKNDTWEWDGRTWTNVTPTSGNPAPRRDHAMAYDAARKRVVMFGGFAGAGAIFNETWEWNGSAWKNVSPAVSPPQRLRFAMAYDAKRDKIVLFGGEDPAPDRADTWEWDGTTWVDRTLASGNPPGRSDHAMAYDPARSAIVMFGGRSSSTPQFDTWEWNGTTWMNRTPSSGNPSARMYPTMAYDTTRNHVVMFGGTAGGDETWEWNGTAWANVTLSSGNPLPRSNHAMAYDTSRGRAVVFGGSTTSIVGETWEWSGTTWQEVSPVLQVPSARTTRGALAYDSARGRVVMFSNNETWEWDGGGWKNVTPVTGNPGNRADPALAYDAKRGQVVMYGGSGLDETWLWNGAAWTNATPVSGNPPARDGLALAYDANRERVVLFGGRNSLGQLLDQTWEWNGSAWANVTPASGNPLARQNHSLAYDARRGRIVLFGGAGATSAIGTLNDTWEWDGTSWSNVTPSVRPPVRSSAAMAYDMTRGRVILFGGGVNMYGFDDTWEWDGTMWLDLTRAGETPPARRFVGMAYDAARARMVLFGGFASSALADTWLFRYESASEEEERCRYGIDSDGDGKIGCADPDCFGSCTPICNPTVTTGCDTTLPRCGDGACVLTTESKRLCPADCGAAPVVCGDFICESPETMLTCPGDCM